MHNLFTPEDVQFFHQSLTLANNEWVEAKAIGCYKIAYTMRYFNNDLAMESKTIPSTFQYNKVSFERTIKTLHEREQTQSQHMAYMWNHEGSSTLAVNKNQVQVIKVTGDQTRKSKEEIREVVLMLV